jgi:hypothetical protein
MRPVSVIDGIATSVIDGDGNRVFHLIGLGLRSTQLRGSSDHGRWR